ncbi:MAG: hypothetical protein ABIB79_02175 [archaeon]
MGCKVKIYSAFLIGIILFCNIICAVEVSSKYWKENPLQIYPGETKEISIGLTSKEDVDVNAIIVRGSEIVEFIGQDKYFVSSQIGTKVNLKVSLPNDAKGEEIKEIELKFSPESKPGEGTVALIASTSIIIPVEVIKEEIELWAYIIIGLGILTILLIIAIILKRKN